MADRRPASERIRLITEPSMTGMSARLRLVIMGVGGLCIGISADVADPVVPRFDVIGDFILAGGLLVIVAGLLAIPRSRRWLHAMPGESRSAYTDFDRPGGRMFGASPPNPWVARRRAQQRGGRHALWIATAIFSIGVGNEALKHLHGGRGDAGDVAVLGWTLLLLVASLDLGWAEGYPASRHRYRVATRIILVTVYAAAFIVAGALIAPTAQNKVDRHERCVSHHGLRACQRAAGEPNHL